MRKAVGIVDSIFIEIYDRAVKDEEASEKSDTPIYRTVPYVRKRIPNSRDVYDQPLKSTDRQKYPELVQNFEAGESVQLEGTPVEQWPVIDVGQAETLKNNGVFTVQQLAGLADSGTHRLPLGFQKLKQKAQDWLSAGNQIESVRKENETLRKQNEDLVKRIEKLEKKSKAA